MLDAVSWIELPPDGKNQFHILFMHFFCQRISHTKAILMTGNTVERIRCFNDFYKIVV